MENSMTEEMHNNDSDDPNGDGEGVWSPDIEQCFREALMLFPPCGRRKHILQEEGGGKMYGRNELIARHIMMRTGKRRTRKQVSSHIQVLARRKAKSEACPSAVGNNNNNSINNNSSFIDHQNSSNTSTSTSSLSLSQATINGRSQQQTQQQSAFLINSRTGSNDLQLDEVWLDRPIVTSKIRLVEFSAFIEYRNSGNNNNNNSIQPQPTAYGITSYQPIIHDGHLNETPDSSYQQQASYNPYLDYQQHQQQQQPLTSNHHLPAQFNQADPTFEGQKEQSIPQKNMTKYHPQITSGFVKHSYIKIDYSKPELRQKSEQQSKHLESININLIQDKFPELNGPDGLYQRSGANCSDSFFLIKFWADLNNDYEFFIDDNQNSFFGFSSHFETIHPYQSITCSIKACSYGLQVVEKVEKIYGQFNPFNNRYSYNISRSPMCEFMIQFIKKLRQLPRVSQMNSVLENFTILQVITNELTSEILLCLAYVFEIASPQAIICEQPSPNGMPPIGPQYHVYKLTRD